MTETNTRPTAEEILTRLPRGNFPFEMGPEAIKRLAAHGYIIVHPDDVPERDDPDPRREDWEDGWEVGWNACRAHIFREEQ